MDRNSYLERHYELKKRYDNAISCWCFFTAKARLRDMAHLKTEYDGSNFRYNYQHFLEEYHYADFEKRYHDMGRESVVSPKK